jgi:hypothetical protein
MTLNPKNGDSTPAIKITTDFLMIFTTRLHVAAGERI